MIFLNFIKLIRRVSNSIIAQLENTRVFSNRWGVHNFANSLLSFALFEVETSGGSVS